jgi:hypothetical protein
MGGSGRAIEALLATNMRWQVCAFATPLRTRWMSHGGVNPLTSPVLFAELPASTRHSYPSSSTNSSSYSVPWITPLPQLAGEVRAARTSLR